MDETQNQSVPPTTTEPVSQPEPETVPEVNDGGPEDNKKSSMGTYIIVAIVAIAILAGVAVYLKDGSGNDAAGVNLDRVIATVNDSDIVGADLATSINQIAATAQLQGIDTTDPNVQSEIQTQAVEMLINTKLLEQEAGNRGIEVSDQDVTDRINALIAEVGSEEALQERMEALGIDDESLKSDVRSELLIQALLDQVFAEEDITVTEAEVQSLYQSTTGGGPDALSIEEMRPRLESQLRANKEQVIVDQFLSTLRTQAAVNIVE